MAALTRMKTSHHKNTFKFDSVPAGKTLEKFLLEDIKLGPRHALKHAFINKMILVNSKVAKRHHCLEPGDVVEVFSSDLFLKKDLTIGPNPKLSLKILLETPEMIVVDKPSAQSVHPLRPSDMDTTLNALVARFPETGLAFNKAKPLEGGLVHRLDRGTSGILICARTVESFKKLKDLWKKGAVKKIYLAWVKGEFHQSGECHLFLSHDPKSKKKMVASLEKPKNISSWKATTSFLPLQKSKDATLVLVRLHTGVTHQIRAVLAALGHAVIGDKIYERCRKLEKGEFLKLDEETKSVFNRLQNCIMPAAGKRPPQPQVTFLPNDGFFLHALWIQLGSQNEILSMPPWHFIEPSRN